jgi:hypothetical protein
MSRGAQSLKQSNFEKALRGAEKAGLKVQRTEVRPDGSFILDFSGPRQLGENAGADGNPWNSVK